MADGQEKTEHVSQKRLEESREKGELPRSQELTTFVVFALFLMYFGIARLAWFDGFGVMMRDALEFDPHPMITVDGVGEAMLMPALRGLLVVAPLLGIVMFVSPLISMTQSQFNIATKKLEPDFARLDPVAGLKRIFSMHQVVEGVKACVKIGMFVWLAWRAIERAMPELALLPARGLRDQLNVMLDLAMDVGLRVAILMAVLAVLDYGYQWWEFNKKMRMTHQEMKDEMKERDGNPLIKQRQRSIQMKRARDRMMSSVPKATVVVANPTHIAVALFYDRETTGAPVVTAKGKELIALRIKEIAREHGVPVVENKLLARALYKSAKIGKVIPAPFFKAVAELLAFVYFLKQKEGGLQRQI